VPRPAHFGAIIAPAIAAGGQWRVGLVLETGWHL